MALQLFRMEGINKLNNRGYENMSKIVNLMLDIAFAQFDVYTPKEIMVLCQTYYKIEDSA